MPTKTYSNTEYHYLRFRIDLVKATAPALEADTLLIRLQSLLVELHGTVNGFQHILDIVHLARDAQDGHVDAIARTTPRTAAQLLSSVALLADPDFRYSILAHSTHLPSLLAPPDLGSAAWLARFSPPESTRPHSSRTTN